MIRQEGRGYVRSPKLQFTYNNLCFFMDKASKIVYND